MNTLNPGSVYQFTLVSGYSKLDGVYRLVKIMTYQEYLEDGGNILSDFYQPCGKSQNDVTADINELRETDILKLVNPNVTDSDNGTFIPVFKIHLTPDFNVSEYKKFGVIAHIGVTKDIKQLDYVRKRIEEQFAFALGILPDVKFVHTGNVWLTDTEYAEEVAKRDTTIMEQFTYFSENKDLLKEISRLKTQNASYEEIMVKQQQALEATVPQPEEDPDGQP